MGKGCRSELLAMASKSKKKVADLLSAPAALTAVARRSTEIYRRYIQYIPGIPSMRRRFETKQGEEKMQGKRFEGQTSTLLDVEDSYASVGARGAATPAFRVRRGRVRAPFVLELPMNFRGLCEEISIF